MVEIYYNSGQFTYVVEAVGGKPMHPALSDVPRFDGSIMRRA